MNWICKHCESDVEEDFDICWSCGASFDGEKNPDFFREIEATELPADGTRLIRCAQCGYCGASRRMKAAGAFAGLLLALFIGRNAFQLTNHTCPECGETRDIYDWKE